MQTISCLMSAIMRRENDLDFLIEELKSIPDPSGGQWSKGKYSSSLVSMIGDTLRTHLDTYGTSAQPVVVENVEVEPSTPATGTQCPECKGYNVIKVSGCPTCQDCGSSKCG